MAIYLLHGRYQTQSEFKTSKFLSSMSSLAAKNTNSQFSPDKYLIVWVEMASFFLFGLVLPSSILDHIASLRCIILSLS